LTTLVVLLQDAENSERGYVITGSDEYLEPYRNALVPIERTLRDLRELTSDNRHQQRRLDAREPLVKTLLGWLRDTNELRSAQGFAAAQQKVAAGGLKKAMDDVRQIVGEMQNEESELLADRDAAAEATARATFHSIVFGTAAAIVFVASVGFLIARGFQCTLADLMAGVARVGEGALDDRIVVRSKDEIGILATAFNQMTDRLRSTMVSAETERQARTQVETLLGSMRQAAGQLSAATAEILASTTQQVAGAAQQAAATAQTGAVIDEVTRTAAQAAEQARGVGEAVQRTAEIGTVGRQAVDESVRTMTT